MASRSINKLVVHHSASSSVTTKRSDLERWHKERGFLDIGYHKVVGETVRLRMDATREARVRMRKAQI